MPTHEAERSDVAIELVVGNIVEQSGIGAVVNAANADLLPGGGVAGAIHRAAGPGLVELCRPLAPLAPGQAVITEGLRLPNRYVVHCRGPVYGRDHPADELLAACYRNALEVADKHRLESIAFPAISTGHFGFPLERAAEVALHAVLEEVERLTCVRTVRFVLADHRALAVHRRVLQRLLDERGGRT